ncbi:MAG TPA: iron transporter [Psychromonas sp.]
MNFSFRITCAMGAALFSLSAFCEEAVDEKQLEPPSIEEILVSGLRKSHYTIITEDAEKLVNTAGSFGDPLAAVSALPGIIIPRNGGSPAVRGSSPADNRYYVDGLPAGYIFHDFNTSIFDENVIQDFQLFPAGFGVQYSGATGAVFDIRLRDPENKKISTKLTASLFRAGIFVESGITENSAFYLSVRKGLLQYFVPKDDEADEDGFRLASPPEDGDYQFKYKWDMHPNHSLTVTVAGANDYVEAEFTDISEMSQRNPDFGGLAVIDKQYDSFGGNYEYVGGGGSLLRLTLASYKNSDFLSWGDDYYRQTRLDNELARLHYTIPLGANHSVAAGFEYSENTFTFTSRFIQFVCSEFDVDCQDGRRDLIEDSESVAIVESSMYLLDNWQVTENVNIEAGVQRSGNDYTEDYYINPRAAIAWDITDVLTITSSAGNYNRTPEIQTVLSLIGNPELESPRAMHLTLGIEGEIGQHWNWMIEGYRKELTNLPLALSQSDPGGEKFYSDDVEGEIHGVDIMINKDLSNKWYGWASLSVANSERINTRTGQRQTYRLDTPVVFNLVANYQFFPNWNAGIRAIYKSGEATTDIVDVKQNPNFPDRYQPVYGEPFADRLPHYSRIDLRFEKDMTLLGREAVFFVDVVNALNRQNVVREYLDYDRVNETGEVHLTKIEDMGTFASVGLSVTF